MKESYYFAHDTNAIQDPKMMSILFNCGVASIGLYWIIIELLHQQEDNKMDYKSYSDFIDFYGRINEENEHVLNKIKEMLISVGLLVEENGKIYSNRVLKNIKQRKIISEKRSLAGKQSGESRKKQTSVEHVLNKNEHNKVNKIKENKIKDINIESSDKSPTPKEIANDFLNDMDSVYRTKFLDEMLEKGIDDSITRRELLKFISYWTEPDSTGRKQRWEKEKTFEIGRRLANWFSRINNFNGQQQRKVIDISNL